VSKGKGETDKRGQVAGKEEWGGGVWAEEAVAEDRRTILFHESLEKRGRDGELCGLNPTQDDLPTGEKGGSDKTTPFHYLDSERGTLVSSGISTCRHGEERRIRVIK